jgi:hypothetical protein
MLLAARALGLGATLTTLYLQFEKEAEAIPTVSTLSGTDGSNPAPSSEESAANPESLDRWNAHRHAAGLDPVAVNAALTKSGWAKNWTRFTSTARDLAVYGTSSTLEHRTVSLPCSRPKTGTSHDRAVAFTHNIGRVKNVTSAATRLIARRVSGNDASERNAKSAAIPHGTGGSTGCEIVQ